MTKKQMNDTELQDVVTKSADSLLGAPALNDSTRAKRPAREKLALVRASGGHKRPGYVRRWVHDKRTSSATGSKIEDNRILGYELVYNEDIDSQKEFGAKMGSVVEKFEADGTRMVLMEIPQDEYDELQQEKLNMNNEKLAPAQGEGIYKNATLDIKRK